MVGGFRPAGRPVKPLVPGRKGLSIVDSIVVVLWPSSRDSNDARWPALSFSEIAAGIREIQHYSVAESTVRSAIYSRPEFFCRVDGTGAVMWRLTRRAVSEASK